LSTTEFAPSKLWSGKIYDGAWREGTGGVIEVTDKGSGEKIGAIGQASVADVAAGAAAAKEAQREWAALPGPHRADIVRKASDLVRQHG
jgi:benzaldehyde dehydrogenase (NAD)